MQLIPSSIKYGSQTVFFTLGRFLERLGYFTFIFLLFDYLTNDPDIISQQDASSLCEWFLTLVFPAGFVGGLIGDFFLGNKRAMIIGVLLEVAGFFTLAGCNEFCMYAGLIMVLLGPGLHFPNQAANYGKSFAKKSALLSGAFMLQYLVEGVAPFSLLNVFVTLVRGFSLPQLMMLCGFITAGGALLSFFTKSEKNMDIPEKEYPSKASKWKPITIVFIGCLGVSSLYLLTMSLVGVLTGEMSESGKMPELFYLSGFISLAVLNTAAVLVFSYFEVAYKIRWILAFSTIAVGFAMCNWGVKIDGEVRWLVFTVGTTILEGYKFILYPTMYIVLVKKIRPERLATAIGLMVMVVELIQRWVIYNLYYLPISAELVYWIMAALCLLGIAGFFYIKKTDRILEN